jgi:hypothetical protein
MPQRYHRVVIEEIPDLPPNTIGFRASGTISRDEYHDQVVAAVRRALELGTVNVLFETAPDFSGLDLGAIWEDTKAAGTFGLKHLSDFGRIAVVTDKDWMRHAVSAFGWLSPGEYRVFELGEREQAKRWIAAASAGEFL